jgi:hypothetical protein
MVYKRRHSEMIDHAQDTMGMLVTVHHMTIKIFIADTK